MGYGLDVGGGRGSGQVFFNRLSHGFLITVSYQCMIFIYKSVSIACIHVLGSPDGQAICLGRM